MSESSCGFRDYYDIIVFSDRVAIQIVEIPCPSLHDVEFYKAVSFFVLDGINSKLFLFAEIFHNLECFLVGVLF